MGFKDALNCMVKPRTNDADLETSRVFNLEDHSRNLVPAAKNKSKASHPKAVQYDDLNIEIDKNDIDGTAKKYYRELRNRQRLQIGKQELSELQPGFLSVKTQALIDESQEPEGCAEIRSEIPSIPRLTLHMRHQKHHKPQSQNHEQDQRRHIPCERENQTGVQESQSSYLRKRTERLSNSLESDGKNRMHSTLNHSPFGNEEPTQRRDSNVRQQRIYSEHKIEQAQDSNTQLSQRSPRCKEHRKQQHDFHNNQGRISEVDTALDSRQRRLKTHVEQQRPHENSISLSGTDPDLRSKLERNHDQQQSPLESLSRLSESSPDLRSRQRRQKKNIQQQGLENSTRLSGTDPDLRSGRDRNFVQQKSPDEDLIILSEIDPELRPRQRLLRLHVQEPSPYESTPRLSETDPELRQKQRRRKHNVQQQRPFDERISSTELNLSERPVRHIRRQPTTEASHQRQQVLPQEVNFELKLSHPRSQIPHEIPNNETQLRSRIRNSPRIMHPCDRLHTSEDETPEVHLNHEDQPPSDEYYAGNEAEIPPYHASLHKYLDLISYDPRVVPCLRVNRAQVKSNDKLSESIFQFLKFNLFPESIDPWEISHIDDQHYDDLIPDLIPVDTDSDTLPNLPHESRYRQHNDVAGQVISDYDYEYALYLSTLENNVY